MPVIYTSGDLFLSGAQTLAHGVNCAGKMGAGIAIEFKARWPRMYKAYKSRCHRGALQPGGYFLWRGGAAGDYWVLNLATQAHTGGARVEYVRDALAAVAASHAAEGITSIAMPRIAAGLGGLDWSEMTGLIERVLGGLPIPVFVYERYVEGRRGKEEENFWSSGENRREKEDGEIFFYRRNEARWGAFSNFAVTPIEIDGVEYPTAEHFFQAAKAVSEREREMVRSAPNPLDAKKTGQRVQLPPDWETVKEEVMLKGLLAKFTQHPELRSLLLSTGERPIHEDSPYDDYWGWVDGKGCDRLGVLIMRVRRMLQDEDDA